MAISPDSKTLYLTDVNGRRVLQFAVGRGGKLKPMSPATVPAGANPYDVAVRP